MKAPCHFATPVNTNAATVSHITSPEPSVFFLDLYTRICHFLYPPSESYGNQLYDFFNDPQLWIEELDMVSKLTNAHKHMEVYYTHRMPATCVATFKEVHYKIGTSEKNRSFPKYRHKTQNFKNSTCLKCILRVKMQIKISVTDFDGQQMLSKSQF